MGSSVSLNVSLSATGGTGGPGIVPEVGGDYFQLYGGPGGNGGGGLVQIQSNSIDLGSSTFNLSGANSGVISEFNSDGSFIGFGGGTGGGTGAVPEPSSLVMAGIATLAGVATTLVRRRSRAA